MTDTSISMAQRDERTKLAAAIRQLLVEFTDETGLVVEEIDIELDDSLFWWNPEAHARYQSVRIKAVLP